MVAASLVLGGCVEATSYEQATSAAEVQAEARRRLGHDFALLSRRVRELEVERDVLARKNADLEARLAGSPTASSQLLAKEPLAKEPVAKESLASLQEDSDAVDQR